LLSARFESRGGRGWLPTKKKIGGKGAGKSAKCPGNKVRVVPTKIFKMPFGRHPGAKRGEGKIAGKRSIDPETEGLVAGGLRVANDVGKAFDG